MAGAYQRENATVGLSVGKASPQSNNTPITADFIKKLRGTDTAAKSEPITADWLRENQQSLNEFVVGVKQKQLSEFNAQLNKANKWQTQETMDDIIHRFEDAYKSGGLSIDEKKYNDYLSDLKSQKEHYAEYSSADEWETTKQLYKDYFPRVEELFNLGEDAPLEKRLAASYELQEMDKYMSSPDFQRTLLDLQRLQEVNPEGFFQSKKDNLGFWDMDYFYVNKYKPEGLTGMWKLQDMDQGTIDKFFSNSNTPRGRLATSMMLQAERDVYNYIHQKEGSKAATEFLEKHVFPRLNGEISEEVQREAKALALERPVTAWLLSVGNKAFVEPVEGALNTVHMAVDPEGYQRNWVSNEQTFLQTNTIRQAQADALGDIGGAIYNVGTGVVDLGMELAMSKIASTYLGALGAVDKVAGLKKTAKAADKGGSLYYLDKAAADRITGWTKRAISSSKVAGETLADARARGLSGTQAIGEALSMAAIEWAIEKIGLDNLLKADGSVLRSFISEGVEEGLSAIASPIVDAWIAGDKSNWQTSIRNYIQEGKSYEEAVSLSIRDIAGDVVYEAALGAFTGGVFKGSAKAISILTGHGATPKAAVWIRNDTKKTKSNAQKAVSQWGSITMSHKDVGEIYIDSKKQLAAVSASQTGQEAAAVASIRKVVSNGTVVANQTAQGKMMYAAMGAEPSDVILAAPMRMNGKEHGAVHSVAVRLTPAGDKGQYEVSGVLLDGDVLLNLTQTETSNPTLATDAETGYTDNVHGDGTRYSLNGEVESTADYDALDHYDSRTYANRGWVTVNRVLTGNELKKLNSQWTDAAANGFKYPTTPSGETIITVGDAYGGADKLVYISGTMENPIISKVVQIKPSDPGDVSVIREMFIKGERAGDVDSRNIIESAFGQEIFLDRLPGDYAGYRELQNQRAERTSNPVGNGEHQQRSNGGTSGAADLAGDRGTVNDTGITDTSLPSNDGTGSNSYTQNEGNPQQTAVGVDSRAQIYEVDRILRRHVAEGEAAADHADNLATLAPTIEEDPSLTKEQRRAKIESDLRESAKEYGIADDVTEAIAYIAGRTGTHVLFVDQVYTKNGTPANGVCFRSQNVILISKNAETPVYEVVKHELAHSIAGTKLYDDLVDFVKQSPQMQQVLTDNHMEFEELVEAKINERAAAGETLDYNGAVEDIVADYVAKVLLTDQARITELFKAQQNVFYKFLYNIRNWMKNVRTPKDLRLLRQAEQRYVKALAQKGKRYYKSTYDTTTETSVEGKYLIRTLPDGKRRYVQADRQVIHGTDPKSWAEQVKDYIDKSIRNNKDVVVYAADGDPLTITKDTSGKARFRNDVRLSDGTTRPMTDVEYATKLRAETHIDELAAVSTRGKRPLTPDTKDHAFAKDGFDYRTAYFMDQDGSYYRITMSVGVNGEINTIYNVGKIKEAEYPLSGSKAVSTKDTMGSASNNRIAEAPPIVNTQYMQEDGKYSVGTDEDFVTALNRMVEQYGKHAPGANAERTIAIPKSTDGQNRVARAARTIGESTEVTPDWFLPQYQQQVLTDAFSYKRKSNRSELAFANEKLESLGFDGALEYWRSKQVEDGSAGGDVQALGAVLLHEAARTKNIAALMELNTGIALDAVHAGQAIQAIKLIKNATPEGRVYVLKKLVDRMNVDNDGKHRSAKKRQQADGVHKRIKEAQKRGADQSVIEALQKELNAIDGSLYLPEACVKDILSQTSPDGLDAAVKRALIEVAKQKPATWSQKWNQWRYLAMLFNLRTHIRNFTSNTVFAPIVQTKNLVKFGIESMVGKGLDHKTASLGNHYVIQQQYHNFVEENYNKNKDKISSGGKYNPTVDIIRDNQTVFKTKPLEWLRKTNSKLLEAEDGVALKFHYTRALAQYLSANDIDPANVDPETLSEAEAYAEKEARKATFRDESWLANWFQELSNKNALAHLVVEGIFPFKKTPINIFNRSIEYSPLGIVGATIDLARMKNGNQDITANDVIDKFASGLTGSLIMGLGAILMHLGVLSGPESDKEKEREWDELQGRQGYSINIGDHSFTLDWLAPSSLPLFVGAQLFEEMSAEGASIGEVLESLTNLTDPIVEMSMLQGIQNIVESASYGGNIFTMAGSAATSYASQAIPTIGGQIARVFDDTRRENYVEQGSPLSGLQYSFQQALGKIPGLENTKKEYVNQWGETEDTGSFVERLFSNMLSPSYYKKARSSVVDSEIERLYNATANSSVLPSSGVKTFTADKKEYVLSAQESASYMKKRGRTSYEMLKKLVDSSAYKAMDDTQRAYAVERIYDYSRDYAQKAVVTSRGEEYKLSSSTQKINTVITEGGDVADYFRFAHWNNTLSSDKNSRGESISGSKKRKLRKTAEDAGYSYREIRLYMKLLGYSV